MSEIRNIYQRINAVMNNVTYVQKDKQISGGGSNYKAVTHDQVISVCRAELVKNGVVIYPEQTASDMPILRDLEKNVKMHLYEGMYNIHFVNVDAPDDRITVRIAAHAGDNGDKAPGKAVTYATKTAILKVLCLETGENDESRVDERERLKTIDEHSQAFLAQQIDGNGQLWSSLCKAYNITHLEQIPVSKEKEVQSRILAYHKKLKEKSNANNS